VSPDSEGLSVRGRVIAAAAVCVIVAAIGYLDYITGDEISITAFYIIPIIISVWYIHPAAGGLAVAACLSTVAAIDYMSRKYSSPAIFIWNNAAVAVFYIVISYTLHRLKRALEVERTLSRADGLTGLVNARHFYQILADEINRASRYRHPLSIIYTDCDNFKRVNDTRGHATGDELLQTVAGAIRSSIRNTDTAARLGGDEFCILLPESDAGASSVLARSLEEKLLAAMASGGWPVTFSMGVAAFSRIPGDPQEMIRAADRMMYEVKRKGKNGIKIRSFD
jgi:diguanylate cyclase (GGDEF)-like protein